MTIAELTKLDDLTAEYSEWLMKHGYPETDADELMMLLLQMRQRQPLGGSLQINRDIDWLDDFIDRWRAAEKEIFA